jgi:hypothetical protein
VATLSNIRPATKKQLHGQIFTKKVLKHFTKDELVHEFTNGRTTRLSEMYETEAINLNKYLKGEFSDVLDRKRKRVIAQCRECGWVLPGDKADMPRIEKWIYETFEINFNDMDAQDLSKAIVAAENMKRGYLKSTYGKTKS